MQISEKVTRNTLPHKPLDKVTLMDVVEAFADAPDLRDVFENHWEQMDFGEDATGEPNEPPAPASFKAMSEVDREMFAEYLRILVAQARPYLNEVASQEFIQIKRRLKNLPDITQNLGVHWSLDVELPTHMASYGGHIVYGEITNNQVDWISSLARAIFWWGDEREITPVAGSAIRLTRIDFAPNTRVKA